ncbi:Replication protein A 32 kDa subunit B [Linum perenne]
MALVSSSPPIPPFSRRIYSPSPTTHCRHSYIPISFPSRSFRLQSVAPPSEVCSPYELDKSFLSISVANSDDELWAAARLRTRSFHEFNSTSYDIQEHRKYLAEKEFEAMKERIGGMRAMFKRVSCINATLPLSQVDEVFEDLCTECKFSDNGEDRVVVGSLDLNQCLRLPDEITGKRPEGIGADFARAYLSNVCVAKELHRNGLGRDLVSQSKVVARDWGECDITQTNAILTWLLTFWILTTRSHETNFTGITDMYVHVAVDNEAAKKLYMNTGFVYENDEPAWQARRCNVSPYSDCCQKKTKQVRAQQGRTLVQEKLLIFHLQKGERRQSINQKKSEGKQKERREEKMYGGGGAAGEFDGGASAFMGGGFMPSQTTQLHDSSASSSKKSDVKRLLPLTLKQINKLATSEESSFMCDGVEVTNVIIVGRVCRKEDKVSEYTFLIDDSTGQIECSRWIQESFDTEEVEGISYVCTSLNFVYMFGVGTYVRVHGHLRGFQGKRFINIFTIRPVTDYNEVTSHFIECIYVHFYNTKIRGGPPPTQFPNTTAPSNNLPRGMQSAPPVQSAPYLGGERMTNLGEKILNLMQQHPYVASEDGIHRDILARQLNVPMQMIMQEMQGLIDNGIVYSTIDDDHYKSTVNG